MIVLFKNLSAPNFRFGKETPVIVARTITFCLLLLLMWALGRIVWIWVKPESDFVLPNSSSVATKKPKAASYQISELLSHNFFGRGSDTDVVEEFQQVSSDARPTNLNLTLVGLVASSDSRYSLAVIGNGSTQQIYGIGETIKGSRAIVRQVMPDRIILQNNGRNEVLMLDGVKFDDSLPNKMPNKQIINSSISRPTSDPLTRIKAEILKNPQNLLKYITLSQQRDDQGITGYRVGPGSDSRLFRQVGLQANDLVVSINGTDVRNPTEMPKIWQKLSDTSEINLIVLRDGQEHNVLIGL